jgi:prophage regulatory protein
MTRFIRRPEVEKITGLSRAMIYQLMNQGTFPRVVPLGKMTVGWVEDEIIAWQKARLADREAGMRAGGHIKDTRRWRPTSKKVNNAGWSSS